MSSRELSASQPIDSIIFRLAELPQLAWTAIKILAEGEEAYERISDLYRQYLDILKDLATLSTEELALIRSVNESSGAQKVTNHNAAHITAETFLGILGSEGRTQLVEVVKQACNAESTTFMQALDDLATRMSRGHKLHAAGKSLADGDPEADKVIWGHTKGLSEEATIHFVMCHFLERLVTAWFSNSQSMEVKEMVGHKDTLLAAMTEVLLLRVAQNRVNPELAQMWTRNRIEGGLKWIDPKLLKLYKSVIAA